MNSEVNVVSRIDAIDFELGRVERDFSVGVGDPVHSQAEDILGRLKGRFDRKLTEERDFLFQ